MTWNQWLASDQLTSPNEDNLPKSLLIIAIIGQYKNISGRERC